MEGKYLKELHSSKDTASERENSLRKELEQTVLKLNTEHKNELKKLQQEMKDKLKLLQQELEEKAQAEKGGIIKEKTSIILGLESECSVLKNKIETVENESKRLHSIVQESEKGLGLVTSDLDHLKQELQTTVEGWENTKKELINANGMSSKLQVMKRRQNLIEWHSDSTLVNTCTNINMMPITIQICAD